jgi:hypothetical protein
MAAKILPTPTTRTAAGATPARPEDCGRGAWLNRTFSGVPLAVRGCDSGKLLVESAVRS